MEKEQKINLFKIILTIILLLLSFILNIDNNFKLLIYIITYLIIGGEVLVASLKNILKGEIFDENFLMAIATIGALVLGDYKEAITVMLFYEIGELFQDMAVEKSKKNITKLMDIRPDYATIKKEDKLIKVDPNEVSKGDIIVVKPGEKIPLDGIITSGTSTLNTVAITGESVPKTVRENDTVISGCINITGLITIKTTSSFSESTVSKILDLVENSDNQKSTSEKFITKFAKIYTPIVVFLAIFLAIIPSLITGSWLIWINRALIFLVISCPCALVVSVPLSFFAGIGACSKNGILVKGSNYLESLAKVKIIVFDKTGTLTKGNFKVVAIHPTTIKEKELLKIAVLAEYYSNHPISISLKEEYKKELDKSKIKNFKDISGKGIKATIEDKEVFIGNDKLMDSLKIVYKPCEKDGTISHIVVDNEYVGHIVVSDEIKSTSKKAISNLRKLGIKNIIMLTGDTKEVSTKIAEKLDINEVKTNLLPTDKVNEITKLMSSSSNRPLAFVGDGINDAPVIKKSDIGISMGSLGSDAAIEASDIVLMNDNPQSIATSINISRKTMKIVKENIVFAISVKIIILILGAMGVASMWLAVFADVGVSFIAILNALRCIKK